MTAPTVAPLTTDGYMLGQSATDKVGLHGATPIAQMTVTTAPAATAATNSSPYGFSQAQADAVITWIRAVDAHLKLKGVIAAS
jgi:hypothetical protein